MPAKEASEPQVVSVTRDSPFQVSYVMSDGTGSAFRATRSMADFIVEAWERKHSSPTVIEQILEEVQELSQIVKGLS